MLIQHDGVIIERKTARKTKDAKEQRNEMRQSTWKSNLAQCTVDLGLLHANVYWDGDAENDVHLFDLLGREA